MLGKVISGPGDADYSRLVNEKTRLEASGNLKAANDVQRIIEAQQRLDAKRDLLSTSPSVAMDTLNAWHEARELARKMLAQGHTLQEVKAAVRPLLVHPSETIGGRRRRRERRAARKARRAKRRAEGKGIFRKIGKALKKGVQFVFHGAAKLNPVLAGARAAVLSLVKRNAGGLATRFHQMGVEKARKKWEHMGGSFRHLQKAVTKGAGAPITGFADDGGYIGADDDADTDEQASEKQGGDGLDKLWQVAKPILEKLLGVFGIAISGKGKETRVTVTEGGKLDRAAKQVLENAMRQVDTAATKAIREQVQDAENPNTGGGPGYNGGVAISPLVLAGVAALVIFASKKR